MHRLLLFLFLFYGLISYGQNSLLNTAFTWFSKGDKTTIDAYLKGYNYQFISETDSISFHVVNYSLVKTENGTQPFVTALVRDTTLEFISLDTYGHKTDLSILKTGRFKSIGTDINGNFITTTYDNGAFLIHQDYEAIPNPLGKGEIAYFRYRILRKYGPFDKMNGEKIRIAANGEKISENYRNGLLDGQRTIYFPDGSIQRTENYRAGRLNGVASDYDPQGKIIHSSTHSYHWKYGMEKWYNKEGKAVKSLQWQRDVPTGTEKQTFNGKTVGSVSYIKGVKQGLAQIPIYYDYLMEADYPLDTLNDAPLAIETVNYKDGLKSGKAVCTSFNERDTIYIAFYQVGKLDSIFNRYGQDGVLYTTNYLNGLEHGKRIYRIPSGPLKDTVSRVENFKNGELDGEVIEYYKKGRENALTDPNDLATNSGQWIKAYQLKTYKNGVLNGPYSFWLDSLIYEHGTYVNGKLHGVQEGGIIIKDQYIQIKCEYHMNVRTGEWITKVFPDSIVIIDHFDNNKKHGTSITQRNGFITEEAHYHLDTLKSIVFLKEKDNYQSFDMEVEEKTDTIWLVQTTKKGNETSRYTYQFGIDAYSEIDTLISSLRNSPEKGTLSMPENLTGDYRITTPTYEKYGSYRNGKDAAVLTIQHFQAEVSEKIDFQDHSRTAYTTLSDKPYSGTFTSATTGEQISVKNGLRHGWCVEKNPSGKEIRKKYKEGVLKKLVETSN
ncbi:MAG: hypothetical protein ACO1N0_10255 [Fluviicola sp.]